MEGVSLKHFGDITKLSGYDLHVVDVMRIVDDADKKAGDKTYILDDGRFYSQAKYIKEKILEQV